ncbi:cytochrome b [Photobacterium sanguinicancri]|uniref:cytochrome b n=1 Tax=Photobacterium sanguinicancri TaxID=875932 RepID=UPI0021C44DCA|nr:cytochrome b/b6 domain-containing protein [Photobacterium sanguinicancri]
MAVVIIYASIAGYTMHLVVNSHPIIFKFLSTLNMSLATIGAALFIIRWVWKFFRPNISYANTRTNKIEINVARMIHSFIYFLMFCVFVSGFMMLKEGYTFFWFAEIPAPLSNPPVNDFFLLVHRFGCALLSIIVILHVSAVIFHHVIRNNDVLHRMTGLTTYSKQ